MPDTALITGASGGIGEALVRLIAAGAANVALVRRMIRTIQSRRS